MADKKINIGLGFNVDKTNLNTLKTELQSLLNMTTDDLIKIGSENAVADLKEIQTAASAVQSALEKSFNPKLNTQDLTKFQQELKMSGQSISSIKASLDKAGASGQNAFRNITTELLTTNRQLKQSNQWLDKMADTMANTVRWTVASSALNAVTGSVQKAYGFTKQLDTSLNDIRIVTGKSADEMARFAKEATTAAKNLGSTTTAYTKAALIYEQQGLGEVDVAARTDVTTKVSNVTGQSAADVSEQLTAIWNGYKVSAAEAELYIDKVSAVAAKTAADLEELSEGMGKVASAANSMGVDVDQLNASLATIISVTRQDASAVGTSLKTIYARIGDLAVDGEDEFGIKLGDVSSKLKTMGIDILDAQGQMREMGEVIEEVAAKWDTWTRAQQQAAAVALAGKRQYNNLIALFENWDMYEEAKSTSQGGAGELQKQQDIYMESMEAHLNQLQAEAEELYQTLLDPEGLNPLIDALTSIVGLAENLIESLGGGAGLLTTLGSIGLNVFSNQITKGITTTIHNITGFKDNLKQAAAEAALINELQITNPEDERQQKILDIAKQRLGIMKSMSEEEYRLTNDTLKQTNELYKQKDALDAKQAELVDIVKTHTNIKLELDKETGAIKNSTEAIAALQSQLTNGFTDSKDTGMKAITGIEELVSLTEDVERKQKSVASRKGKVTQFSNQQKDAAQEHTIAISADMVTAEEQEMAALAQDRLRESTDKLEKAQSDLARSQGYLKQSQDAVSAANNNSAESIAALLDQIEKEVHNEDYSIDQKKELLEIQRALTNAFDKDGKIHTKNSDVVKAAADAVKKYNITIKKQESSVKSAVKELDTFNNKLKENKQRTEEAETKLKELKKSFDLTKAVQDITSLVGGVANLGNGIKTLTGLGNIWSNEDLTGGEKLLQTVTSLSFALPQMVSGFNKVKESFTDLRTSGSALITNLKEQATSLAVNKTLQSEYNLDLANGADRKKIYTLVSKEMTLEEKKHLRELIIKTKAGDANAKKELEQIVAEKLHVTSLKTLKISLKETAAAALSAIVAMWPLLAIAAAIGAIVGAIHLIKAYNTTDEEAFNNAKQRQNELSQALQETKQKYEDLKNSIEDYKNARNSLDELTAGTTAWKEALADANSQALALLQTYPELAKYVHKDENGLITIAEEGLNALANKQLNDIYKAQTASLIGGAIARNAKNELDTSNRSKDFGINEKTLDAILKLESDTILNPEEFANSLKSESIGIKDEALINSLNENREEIFALKQTVDATNHLLAVESGEIVSNILNRYGYGVDSGVLGGIITSNMLAEGDQQEAIDELKKSISISSSTFDAWAYAMGIEADAGSFKNDAWNAQVKYTVDGEEKTISYDQFKKELATYKYYYENTREYLDNATELLAKIGKTTTTETNNIIRSVFASNQVATKDSIEDFSYQTANEINKILEEQAHSLTEGQITLLKETHDNIKASFDDMGRERLWFDLDLTDNIQPIQDALVKLFGAIDWDSLISDPTVNYSLLSGLGDVLSRIRLIEGESGLNTIIQFFNKFTNPTEFIKNIDWTSDNLWIDIAHEMRGLGMEIDYANTTIASAVQYFSQLNGVLETSAERATKTKTIINGLDYGNIIKQEDYEYLFKTYGNWIDEYFTQMEDGTAILTTSAWDFYDAYAAIDQMRRKNKLDSLLDQYGDFGELQKNYLQGSKINVETYKQSKAQEREDYKNSLKTNLTLDGISGSSNYWNATNDKGRRQMLDEDSSIALLKAYFKTPEGADLYAKVQKKFGDPANWNEKIWEDIVQGWGSENWTLDGAAGYDQIAVDIPGLENEAVKLSDAYNAVVNHIVNSDTSLQDISYPYHNGDDLQRLVDDAIGKGYINTNTEEYKILKTILDKKANASTDLDYRINSDGSSAAFNAYRNAIIATQGSLKEIKTEALGLFSNVTSDTELQDLIIQYESRLKPLLGPETWNKLITQGTEIANIAINDAEAKKHETSISNIDEAYQNLNETIESLNKQLDNTFGQERVNLLNQINDAIDRQNTLLSVQSQLTQNEINRQLTNEGSEVSKAFDKVGGFSAILAQLGIEDDGVLTADEYDQIINKLLDSDDGTITDSINTIIANLGPLFDTITTNSNSIFDNNLQKIENALDAFDTRFKEAHGRNEVAKSYNDFMKEFATEDNDYFGQLNYDIDTYRVAFDDASQSMTKIKELAAATVDETGEGYIIGGETLTLEQLRTQVLEEGANLQEYALSLKESLTNLQELEIAQIEEIAEQYDNIVGHAESWNELLEHQLTLSQLINGENYEANKNIYSAQEASLKEQLRLRKEEYETYRNIVDKGPGADEAGYKEAQQKMLEAGQDVAAITAELAQFLVNDFARKIKGNFDSLYEGIESAQKQYEWISERSEKIFDQITGALESQKAVNEWTKVMNDTQDTRAQKQMKDFISAKENELKLRREASKLSQHDLDIAQAEFDLLQAKIALEDARNNKTQMRLTRGADGSYSYQYVADTAAIVEAEQAVADAGQNVMEKSKNAVKEAIESVTDGLAELKDYYIEAFSDNELDNIEKNTLTKMWDAIVKDEELLQERIGDSIASMREAAATAGISVTELTDEQMKQFFPELDSSLYDWIKNAFSENGDLADFDFVRILEEDAEAAKKLLETLGGYNNYITTTTGDDKKSLVEEIKELLTGLGADEKSALTASITQLDEISKATDTARESFDKFATSITTVVGSLKELGTTMTSEEWLKILNGDEEKGIVGLKNLSFGEADKDENAGKTTFIDEWNDIKTNISNSISNLVTETTNTLKNFGSFIKDKIINTEIASTVKTEIGNISISFPDAISREEITGALEDFFNNTEQFVIGGGASRGDISVPITPPIVHSGVSVPRIPSTVRPEIK